MPLSPGAHLGPYEVLALIGAGGMGEVYRARDARLGRDVALKVVPDLFADDPERLARFEREARTLASLNHAHIAHLHGLEESGDQRALVMELVEGPTLAERIARGAVPVEEALPLARQIAEALEYAHEHGIIHRDLKPANIKVTGDGAVKVLDFGLARAFDSDPAGSDLPSSPTITSPAMTRAGVILGTAAYMSPEQARGATVDTRADVWAFGVVLYEMLTGRPCFHGDSVTDVLAAVVRAEPDWTALPSETPARVRDLLRRCLTKDRRERLQSIGDARIEIRDYLAAPPLAGGSENIRPKPHADGRRREHAYLALAAALALAVLALAAGWWHAAQPVSHPVVQLDVDLGPDYHGSDLSLSPDGTHIVYAGRGVDGKYGLYARALDRNQPVPLPGTENAGQPFFSPDGQYIGFFADRKLKKTSVDGGGAAVLCEAPEPRGGSWGVDGTIIAALRVNAGLSRVSSDGGAVQPATELMRERKEVTHRWPQVLPGAEVVVFTVHTATGGYEEATIQAQSLRTGERRTLVQGGYFGRVTSSGHLLYVRQGVLYAAPMDVQRLALTGPATPVVDRVSSNPLQGSAPLDVTWSGTLVYVRSKMATPATLLWLDRAGLTQPFFRAALMLPPPPPVLTAAVGDLSPRFSPDGTRLALSMMVDGNLDVWVYDIGRDTMSRLTSTPGLDHSPVWSPSGRLIVFASERDRGRKNLYWMRADGAGDAVRLTDSQRSQVPFSFSPDGKRLAFIEGDPQTILDLWTLPLEDVDSDHPKPGKPEPLLVTPFNESAPRISPDGRWLAYLSDESGAFQAYVRRLSGPGKWQISGGGARDIVWSKKEREIFYGSDQGIMLVSYTASGDTFVASTPRMWTQKNDLEGFDLAPDGKRFVVLQRPKSQEDGSSHEVVFVLNFLDELRRRVPAGSK